MAQLEPLQILQNLCVVPGGNKDGNKREDTEVTEDSGEGAGS